MDKIAKLQSFIDESKNIVFFGGAGVSTESGVPDFRSKDGLYNKIDIRFEKYTPEYLLSHSCLVNEPKVFFEFYRQKMDARNVSPNKAHLFLTELEKSGKLKAIVTQNIDGLHQKAGSKNVYEIHGTTLSNYCMKCHKRYPEDYIYDSKEDIPHCSCGGIIRCDVTLYEESLPDFAVEESIKAIRKADLLIIGGTSLTVYPAASFVYYFSGKHIAIINRDHIPFELNEERDVEINDSIGEVFSHLHV